MKIATAYVELRADTTKMEREVRQQAQSLGTTFAGIFGAMAFGAGLNKAIQAGSRLEQSVGAIDAVFGKSTRTIDNWAKGADKAFGLSEAAAREALALIGSQLKNFGFDVDDAATKGQELVALGADLAATFGGTTADAVQAVSAALRGEFDTIERYAVSINEVRLKAKAMELGLYDGKGALDANTKAQAVLAVITEQTAAAHGQFARELDTVAGKQAVAAAEAENSAASLGQNLAPVYERMVELVGYLAEGFGKLPAPLQYATLALMAMVALAGPISALRGTITAATTAIGNMGTKGKIATGVLGALGGVLVAFQIRSSQAAAAQERMADAMNEVSRASDAQLLQTFVDVMSKAAVTGRDVDESLAALAQTNLEGARRLEEYISAQEASGELGEQEILMLGRLRTAIDTEEQARDNAQTTMNEFSDEVGIAELAIEGMGDAAGTAAGHFLTLESRFRDLIGELDQRDAFRNAQEAIDDIAEALAAVWNPEDERPIDEKMREYEQAVDDAKRATIDWATEVEGLPAEAVTEVLALVDKGSLAEAEALLSKLEARANRIMVNGGTSASERRTAGSYGPMRSLDVGGYVARDEVAQLHGNEVVLPLGKPRRMAELLGDPRVGPAVAAAMGGDGASVGSMGGDAGGGERMVVQLVFGDKVIQEVEVALDKRKRGTR